jgi:hypothetical protein
MKKDTLNLAEVYVKAIIIVASTPFSSQNNTSAYRIMTSVTNVVVVLKLM